MCAAAEPFQLPAQKVAPFVLRSRLHFLPLCLFLQEDGIVALIRINAALIQLQNPVGHPVQEVPVMGNQKKRASVPG
ncbi:hypothetical protein D3C87_1706960 [compost metagenome]